MRKKVCLCFIIILIFISYNFNSVKAAVITGKNANEIILYEDNGDANLSNEKILNSLKADFGYSGKLYKPLIIDTTVTITDLKKGKGVNLPVVGWVGTEDKYTIRIGNLVKEKVSKDNLINIYGYDESWGTEPEVNTSWNITIEAENVPEDYETKIVGGHANPTTEVTYEIKASKVWSYKQPLDRPKEIEDEEKKQEEVLVNNHTSITTEIGEFVDGAAQIKAWLEELGKDFIGTIIKSICKGIRAIFDSLQAEINKFKTVQDGIPDDSKLKLMYSYEELAGEQKSEDTNVDYTILNKYTQVSEFNNGSKEWQKKVYIENDEETQGFSRKQTEKDKDVDKIVNEGTNIPVAPVELYGMALGNIDIFSADFINGQNNGNTNTFWNNLRKIFALVVHVVLAISFMILLIALIYHGLSIVYGSINPQKRVDHMEGLKRFAFALVILVGTIVFMELCTYGSHIFFDIVKMQDENGNITEELPIRVNVNGVYSFSTNLTGYFRFMSLSKKASAQFLYTVIYIVLVVFNTGFAVIMFLRMLFIWFLSIIGPIAASAKVLNLEDKVPINYEIWAKWYIMLSAIQFIMAIIYRVIMESAVY